MWELITTYWRETTAVVAFLGMFVAPKFKRPLLALLDKVKGIKRSKPVLTTADSTVEELDQDAIRHLRQRATLFADEELLKNIRIIDAKFYDAHCANDCAVSDVSAG